MSKQLHRYMGLLMLLPIIGWAITGVVFFVKPGYQGAYEILHLKTYPLNTTITIPTSSEWQEVKVVKSILGIHVLAKKEGSFTQLNPTTFEPRPLPTRAELITLLSDTVSHNIDRYGSIKQVSDNTPQITALTSTGVQLGLDWNELTFTQRGKDRAIIATLYKIHYLQWTPWKTVNQVLGIAGLVFISLLSILGLKLFISGKPKTDQA